MRTAVHGMPRIGPGRALKRALEGFWAGRVTADQLEGTAASIRRQNWETMAAAGVDFVPSNDFSLYDHMLDAALLVGAVPARFGRGHGLRGDDTNGDVGLERYFTLARGGEVDGHQVGALDLTKWFDTNYHQLVPELGPDTVFRADVTKAVGELAEASGLGIPTTPVVVGPLTFLLRSAPAERGFDVMSLLDPLVDTYLEVLAELRGEGVAWVRLDEPSLVEERSVAELQALDRAYRRLCETRDRPDISIATYFGQVGAAMSTLVDLPVEGVGLDFCRRRQNLDLLRAAGGLPGKVLFAGVVDGRNVWANDLEASLDMLGQLDGLAEEAVASTSCSLLHVPLSLAAERVTAADSAPDHGALDGEVRPWLSFAHEKLGELAVLARAAGRERSRVDADVLEALEANRAVHQARRRSSRVVDDAVRRRVAAVGDTDRHRPAPYLDRALAQRGELGLPLLPTTTIGSFPQTPELRTERAAWRAGQLDDDGYRRSLQAEIDRVVTLQEQVGLDVLVHGEPERDDMVRYFADQLTGFVLPAEGWVQSYGSRCVRPAVLFGDVSRPGPITVEWARYAQSRTTKPVKGMLTGPVTMLRWSFVRDDQPEADTAMQLALAIRDELVDLQSAGTAVIQVDEPALREGLPLRAAERPAYLSWATRAFRLVTSAADAATQVHTHMCYAQLGDIVDAWPTWRSM